MTQFDLKNFKRLPDGSYQKISNPQPRDLQPKVSVKVVLQPTNIEFESGKAKVKKVKPTQHVYFNGMDIQDVYAQCEREGTIFIKGNVPSLKNSKQLFTNKRTGKNFITSSALCKKYVQETDIHYRVFKPRFLEMIKGREKPYTIQMFFVRDKHKAFDYINVSQIVFDIMQVHDWIENDDNRNVIPNFDCGFGYDPKLSGVIIKIL
jgi:hypothetical protein